MQLVASPADLDNALRSLRGAPRYFIDTEFESSRRGKCLSLIQVSAGHETWVIDALAPLDLRGLGKVLVRPETEWVLHAGLQDVELLLQAFHTEHVPALFDTQIVWALLGPEASVSLAFLQYKLLGVRTTKGYQTDDWMRRPLPQAQLQYAAEDIVHLPELYAELDRRAAKLQRPRDLIHAACREFLIVEPAPPQRLSFRSFRNAWQLDGPGQRALKELVEWSNDLQDAGEPLPFQSRTLLSIASRNPHTPTELGRIKGVPGWSVKQHGKVLLQRIQKARSRAGNEAELEPPAYGSFDENRIEAQLQLARALSCEAVCVAPEVALPSALMKRMSADAIEQGTLEGAPAHLTGWRHQLLARSFQQSIEAVTGVPSELEAIPSSRSAHP